MYVHTSLTLVSGTGLYSVALEDWLRKSSVQREPSETALIDALMDCTSGPWLQCLIEKDLVVSMAGTGGSVGAASGASGAISVSSGGGACTANVGDMGNSSSSFKYASKRFAMMSKS